MEGSRDARAGLKCCSITSPRPDTDRSLLDVWANSSGSAWMGAEASASSLEIVKGKHGDWDRLDEVLRDMGPMVDSRLVIGAAIHAFLT